MRNYLIFPGDWARAERILFICFLILNLVNVWSAEVFISQDGPAHLYNAGLLNRYHASEFLKAYYSQNSIILPNYLSHLLLSQLYLLFDPITSEKLLLSLMVIFLPLSFRSAVLRFSETANAFSFLVFPLVFCKLLYMGFYNFTLAFIFFNFQLVLFHKLLNQGYRWPAILLFMVNLLVLFYAHAMVFVLAIIVMFLYTIVFFKVNYKASLKNLLLLFCLCLPVMVLFLVFLIKIHVPDYNIDLKPYEKSAALFTFSPGTVFDVDDEQPFASVISLLLIFLSAYAVTTRLLNKEKVINSNNDLFLVISLLFIYLIFHSKDGQFGGMFADRTLYLVFYFLVFWLCCTLRNSGFMLVFSLLLVVYSYGKLSFARAKVTTKAGAQASSVMAASAFIPDNSVVCSVNFSHTWFHQHFSNYLALNKTLVLSDNYEAVLGWFPLKWKDKIRELKCGTDTAGKTILPDYIFIYGKHQSLSDTANRALRYFVNAHADRIFESQDKFCTLYRLNHKTGLGRN